VGQKVVAQVYDMTTRVKTLSATDPNSGGVLEDRKEIRIKRDFINKWGL
jgi:hypothetical protein